MNNFEERRIINGIKKGDQLVLKHFYKEHFFRIEKLVFDNSGSAEDAQDVFQDALLIMYQKLQANEFGFSSSIETYFYGICKNMWRNTLRKKLKTSCCGNIKDKDFDITNLIEYNEREHIYRKHFLNLNCKCQQILTMFFEGKSMNQIAMLTNYSEGYVRKKKFNCKKSLMVMIEKDPSYAELALPVNKVG